MEDKSFLLIIMIPGILVFIALLNFIGNGGAFGLNPIENGCLGKKIDLKTIDKYFSYGKVEIKTPVYIKYWVPEETDAKMFCLGQNTR